MKKIFTALAIMMVSLAPAFSQMSVNPVDDFYEMVQLWQIRGIVEEVPLVRPYPVNVIKGLIEQVMEKGTERDRIFAQNYLDRLVDRRFHFGIEADGKFNASHEEKGDGEFVGQEKKGWFGAYPTVMGDMAFMEDDRLSFGYKGGITLTSDKDTDFLPRGGMSEHDAVFDASEIGPVDSYLDFNTIISYGTRNVFVQTGLYRSGFGDFMKENLALNDTRFHSANVGFGAAVGKFRFSQQLSVIGATTGYDGNIDGLSPDKMIGFHAVEYDVFDWASLGFYETVVFGKRFDFSCMVPAPYMISGELTGASDNIGMGLTVKIRPAAGFQWATDIFVDDFSINDVVKLNLDSKYRLGAQTGVDYVPSESVFSRVGFRYCMITPYTYSHWEYASDTSSDMHKDMISYQDYTNNGITMGSSLGPNSDKVSFNVQLRPTEKLKLDVLTAFSRHGNISETLDDEEAYRFLCTEPGVYSTSGDVFQHSMYRNKFGDGGEHVHSAWHSLNWLSQQHQMYTVDLGINSEYCFAPTRKNRRVTLKAGVQLEYIHNYGVDEPIYGGRGTVISSTADKTMVQSGDVTMIETADGVKYSYKGKEYDYDELRYLTDAAPQNVVEQAKQAWIDNLTDKFTAYFSCGVNIRF
ncbi:MAG: hypothetical protein MJZ50_00920 [Treponema sp.]|nr:hypothetical protein [Treponema sp.]